MKKDKDVDLKFIYNIIYDRYQGGELAQQIYPNLDWLNKLINKKKNKNEKSSRTCLPRDAIEQISLAPSNP